MVVKNDGRIRGGIQHLRCPSCGEKLTEGARQCECGWRLEDQIARGGNTCSYRAGQKQCRFPASIEQEGRRLCRFHYGCESPVYGEAVVEESEDWAKKVSRGEGVVMQLTTERGIAYPSYIGFAQRAESEKARVEAFLKKNGLNWRSGESRKDWIKRVKEDCKRRLANYKLGK